MGTRKCKPGLGMVKGYVVPLGRVMAGSTILFRIIFLINKALVDVFMAIGATDTDLPETPFLLFLVTGKTRGCKVRPFKLKDSRIMLFDGKRCPREAFGSMAGRTIGWNPLFYELTCMIIGMAI